MKRELISKLHGEFEKHANIQERIEYWLARDLQKLLGYEKWDNFLKVIEKAKTACLNSNNTIQDHFADVGKMVTIGSGAPRDIGDIKLTRYACYLIAQNGDPRKTEISFAQTYFAVQTRKQERLLNLLRERKSMAPGEIWGALKISKQGALDLIKPLIKAGLVKRVGTRKSGKYILK